MKSLLFGEASRRLYGVYHPPAGDKQRAILLCHPAMQEYNESYWMFRRLATLLAAEGHHVLRFDYFGTGNSDGDSDHASPESAVSDVQTAAEALLALSGVSELSLVGLRLGAAYAALACSRGLSCQKLVLWEPVIVGTTYVSDLEELDTRHNLLLLHAARTRGRRDEILGFPFSRAVRSATEAIDLTRVPLKSTRVAVFTSAEHAEHRALCDVWTRAGVPTVLRTVSEPVATANAQTGAPASITNASARAIVAELDKGSS